MRHSYLSKGKRNSRHALWARAASCMLLAVPVLAIGAVGAGAQTTSPPAGNTQTVRVTGTIYDSVAREQLRGAQVQFLDAETRARVYSAIADSLGNYHIDSVPPGKYIAGFFHPSVDVLGIEAPLRAVTVNPGAPNVINLATPGSAHVLTALCGPGAVKDSSAALAGVVRDAATGAPVPGATIVVRWIEMLLRKQQLITQERAAPATTDADGGYRMCGLPGGDTLFTQVSLGALQAGPVILYVAPGQIARRDFSLGDSASIRSVVLDSTSAAAREETTVLRGTATLSGLVLGLQHEPLTGARIGVRGTGLEVLTGTGGRFTIQGLPAGTFSVEAHAIGLEPQFIPTDLVPGTTKTIQITFDTKLQELSRVVVVGKIPKPRLDIEEFERRRKTGVGHFYVATDLALRQAGSLSDLFGATMGLRVMPTKSGHSVFMRDGCPATIYLDGMKMLETSETIDNIPPNQIAGIEIYKGTLEEPPRYNGNACGVILIWRKR